jgi:hypothetical protein
MGKKDPGSNKRRRQEEENEEVDITEDPELHAEMAALEAIRNEKGGNDGEEQVVSNTKNTYNSGGLLKSVEDSDTANLSFIETLKVSGGELIIEDDNDDLNREVRPFYQMVNHPRYLTHLYFLS